MPQLRRLLADRIDLAFKYEIETSTLRRVSEIIAVEHQLFDRLCYSRSPASVSDERPADYTPELWETARAAALRIEVQYGPDLLRGDTKSPFDWGILSGKVSATRWVLGGGVGLPRQLTSRTRQRDRIRIATRSVIRTGSRCGHAPREDPRLMGSRPVIDEGGAHQGLLHDRVTAPDGVGSDVEACRRLGLLSQGRAGTLVVMQNRGVSAAILHQFCLGWSP